MRVGDDNVEAGCCHLGPMHGTAASEYLHNAQALYDEHSREELSVCNILQARAAC